ncbi:MAG: hypothetical protein M9947_18110 [Thermomicrobiales bacterium]|nr:hypothetical protein [Thermomicrobiales bacterium]
MKSPTSFKQIGNLLLGIALVVVLAACSRGESVNPLIPTPTSEDASPESNATPEQARQPCSDGTMLVGDIPAIDGV